jgi:hypothetical protein
VNGQEAELELGMFKLSSSLQFAQLGWFWIKTGFKVRVLTGIRVILIYFQFINRGLFSLS